MNADDDGKPLAGGEPEKRIKGPTFDIMSDEEIEEASAKILEMIEGAESSGDEESS